MSGGVPPTPPTGLAAREQAPPIAYIKHIPMLCIFKGLNYIHIMSNFNELISTLKTKKALNEVKSLNELFDFEGVSPDLWTNYILSSKAEMPIAYSIIMEGLKSSNSEGWQSLVGTEFEVSVYQIKTLSNGSVLTLAILSDGRRISVNKSFVSLIEAESGVVTLFISSVDKAEIKGEDSTKVYASCSLTLDQAKALTNEEVLQRIKAIESIEESHLQKWVKALSVEQVSASPVVAKPLTAAQKKALAKAGK